MNAHAMIGPYTANFNTAAMANNINTHNFANLPIDGIGDIVLGPGQALYLYGGRKSLVTALSQFPNLRIYGPNWVRLVLFGTQRKASNRLKTKQLLMVAQVPRPVPNVVLQNQIQVKDDGIFSRGELISTIQNLPK